MIASRRPAAAARELAGALRLVRGHGEWAPPVVTCSALTDVGVDDVWTRVEAHREHLGPDGLARKRAGQQLDFTWALVRDELDQRLRRSPGVAAIRDDVRAAVLSGELAAPMAADRILAAYDSPRGRCVTHIPGTRAERPAPGPPCRNTPVVRDRLNYAGGIMSDTPAGDSPTTLIATVIEKYADQLIDFRRDLHAHPELAWTESRTTGKVIEALADTGLGVHPGRPAAA